MQIIDRVLNMSVNEIETNNELVTLHQLATGLNALANTVAQLEAPFRVGSRRWVQGDFSCLGIDQTTSDLLPSLFHWYGISACNYARLVGFLSGISEGKYSRNSTESADEYEAIKNCCDAYVDSIPELANIRVWRNKVFAHFAITDPRKTKKDADSSALLDVSTMSPVWFSERRFVVGDITINTRGAEVTMPGWSLTETYEQLSQRFDFPSIAS